MAKNGKKTAKKKKRNYINNKTIVITLLLISIMMFAAYFYSTIQSKEENPKQSIDNRKVPNHPEIARPQPKIHINQSVQRSDNQTIRYQNNTKEPIKNIKTNERFTNGLSEVTEYEENNS